MDQILAYTSTHTVIILITTIKQNCLYHLESYTSRLTSLIDTIDQNNHASDNESGSRSETQPSLAKIY